MTQTKTKKQLRPADESDGVRVTLYLPAKVRDRGQVAAKSEGTSLSRLVTQLLSGYAPTSGALVEIDGVYLPSNYLDPFYADQTRAVRVDNVLWKDEVFDRALVLWADISPRPGDMILTKTKTPTVAYNDPASPYTSSRVAGVVLNVIPLG